LAALHLGAMLFGGKFSHKGFLLSGSQVLTC